MTLVSGQLLNAYAVASTAAADIPKWDFGSAISAVVYAGITGPVKILFAAVFGFVYAPLVITGLHHMTNAIDLQLVADFGGTMLWPMIALSNIAQGSAVLAMIVLQKKDAEKQEVNIPSCISCYLGVTEPAIFGINLKYMFPFVCAMTGSALAAVFSVATGCMASSIGVGGLPGILSIIPTYWGFYAIAMAIAIGVPFALTYVVGKSRGIDKEAENAAADAEAAANREPAEFTAFLTGKTVAIEDVPDQVFASKALGEGIAIDPVDNVLVAPADAMVSITMPDSNHAVGLRLMNGAEILLHIGLDTVGMHGDGFKCLVKENERVKKGQPLIEFDPAKIKAANHPLVTMMVITDDNGFEKLTFKNGIDVKAGTTTIGTIG